jgi:predicted Zn-dependent peptidase
MKKLLIFCLFILIHQTVFAGETMTLDNGVKLTVIERPFTETASVSVFIKGGIFRENKENNGVGALTANTWVKGSKMLEEMEFYGGSIGVASGTDSFEISFSSTAEYLDKAISLFGGFLYNPVFDKEVFDREKSILLEEIKAIQDDPGSLAFRNFMKISYAGTPYALNIEGEMETVEKLAIGDLKTYHANLLEGVNVSVSVAGKITKKQIKDIAAIFSKMKKGEKFVLNCSFPSQDKDTYTEEKDPRTQQAKLYLGYAAPQASSPDYAALKVMADILGGGMSSRYFTELRKNRGYAYSVGAFYPSRLCASRFMGFIGLDESNIQDAVKTMEDINTGFLETLSDDELQKVKNHILGKLLIETESNGRQAWYSNFFINVGLGADYLEKYIEEVKKVDKDSLKKAAEIFKGHKTVYVLK